jgi:LysM repeat protein
LKFKKIFLGVPAFLIALFLTINVWAARTDMIDLSSNNNHGKVISSKQFVRLRNNYGIKAVMVKLSEGKTYRWKNAAPTISNAKLAGLYTNGYHFARYTTLASAQLEAQNAIAAARGAGLGIGAVIVADVEAVQQKKLPLKTNDANNAVFQAAIEKAGYRFDLYTMASWMNSKLTIKPKSGWIAAYPSQVSQDRYADHHAWQFSSKQTYTELGLSGHYDVSQLYDPYYTANQRSIINDAATAIVSRVKNNTKAKMNATKQPESSSGVYLVQKGDCWWTISQKYGISMYALARQNGKTIDDLLYPGQILQIKRLRTVVSKNLIYTVKSGDTLSQIATKYQTSYLKLAALNNIKAPYPIYPKQRIQITPTETISSSQLYYTVSKNDTVGGIAAKHGTTVNQIQVWNELKNVNLIYVGQKLRIK